VSSGDLFGAPARQVEPGWPEFDPHEAVRQITRARTPQRRLELLAGVPRGWQKTILHFVVVRLAGVLFDAPQGDRAALSQEIPPEWLDLVRAHYGRHIAQAKAHAAIEAARKHSQR
jgi:hypothetical protein